MARQRLLQARRDVELERQRAVELQHEGRALEALLRYQVDLAHIVMHARPGLAVCPDLPWPLQVPLQPSARQCQLRRSPPLAPLQPPAVPAARAGADVDALSFLFSKMSWSESDVGDLERAASHALGAERTAGESGDSSGGGSGGGSGLHVVPAGNRAALVVEEEERGMVMHILEAVGRNAAALATTFFHCKSSAAVWQLR